MDREKDSHFTRNVTGVATVELFWGLGFPIVLESTFLQLFLKNLGASGFVIGLVPSVFIVGISCFPLFASYLTRNIHKKRMVVLLLHLISGVSILLLGGVMLFTGEALIIPLFFTFYAIFSVFMGLTIPVWLNYLVRIFSEKKTVPGIGYMMLAQNIGKVISSFFILGVVEKYAFSITSCSIIFIITGVLFVIGSMGFVITKEVDDKPLTPVDTQGLFQHTISGLKEMVGNRMFVTFLIADLDFYVVVTTMSFYANYATEFFSIPQAIAAGLFVGCIYGGSIAVNITLGTLDILSLKGKFILSKCLSLIALLLLALAPGYGSFLLISFLLGGVRAIRNMVYTPSVKKLSAKEDVTSYFALAPIVTLPVGLGYPMIFGKMLDTLAFLGADSYRLLFMFSAMFVLVTAYFTLKTDYTHEKKT